MEILTDVSLAEIIRDRICTGGPISFRDYMEMALYHPELGYYSSASDKIGENGDYYTCPHYSCILGAMLARQIEEMWQHTGRGEFTIVEYGAGTGAMCRDILAGLRPNRELFQNLRYCIIEKSASMREKEKCIVHEKVTWHESIHELHGMTGCILSNELLDNFSVNRVVMQDELMEVFVDYDNGFTEVLKPASDEFKEYFEQLNITLPKGFCAEVSLDALVWLVELAAALKKGFLLTIDYGYLAEELYSAPRRNGTLVCYNRHKVNTNPYINIGRQDITAHVNFSALHHWGTLCGLKFCGFTSQAHFLQSLGLSAYLWEQEKKGNNSAAGKGVASFTHTLMTDMGSKFKVLIQQKGLDRVMLSGLRFSQKMT